MANQVNHDNSLVKGIYPYHLPHAFWGGGQALVEGVIGPPSQSD